MGDYEGAVTDLLRSLADGKIAPHKLVWPAFWAVLRDGKVEPLPLTVVTKGVGEVLSREKFPLTDRQIQ